jgi:hypothetical protein
MHGTRYGCVPEEQRVDVAYRFSIDMLSHGTEGAERSVHRAFRALC